MDRLIQMGKDLGYEGENCKTLFSSCKIMKGERESRKGNSKGIGSHRKKTKGRIGSRRKIRKGNLKGIGSRRRKKKGRISSRRKKKDREIELARIATEEAKADKDRELEEAKIAANERLEMARIEGIAEQAERERE